MHRTCLLIFVLLLLAPQLNGQPASSQQEDTRPLLPATINGDLVPVDVVPEMQRTREWAASLGYSTACDDNALGTPTDAVSDCAAIVQPGFSLTQTGSRTSWKLSYGARLAEHFRFSSLNEVAHSAGLDVQHRFTRRFSMRFREAFAATNGFGWSPNAGDLPTFGLIQKGNSFAITPAVSHLNSTTGAEGTWRLSADSFVGMTGSYSALRYTDSNTNSLQLIESDTVTAGTFYGRNLGRHNWLGVNYDWQHIQSGTLQTTVSHSLMYTHTLVLTKKLVISGFVGPQYSRTNFGSVQPSFGLWSLGAGGTVGWKNDSAQITASGSQLVSDGGGLLGAVQLKQVSASANRNFGRAWTISVTGYYADSSALKAVSTVRTFSVSAGVERRIRENFLVGLAYGRDWQDAKSTAASTGVIERNRVAVTVSYNLRGRLGK